MTHCCWREHSKSYPKGVTPPKTLESLQAAWDRDQELIFDQKDEIARLKVKLNKYQQS